MLSSPNLARPQRIDVPPSFSDKVAFLSVPESYRERTGHVSVIQTSHAWVFLTDRYAYKLKKPSRHGRMDFSSLESRHHLCQEEYRLNRRLARRTYVGVVPLVLGRDRRLELDGDGAAVEWLVKMRRLPSGRFLPVAAANGVLRDEDVTLLMQKLLRFYADAPVCEPDGPSYVDCLLDRLATLREELETPDFQFPHRQVNDVVDRQIRYVRTHAEYLESRRRDGRIREVHGDLRPEHVCLVPGAEPEIIDCLEFDPLLRCLDCAEEIAFLGLECRMMGHPWIEEKCIESYRSGSGDAVPTHLWHFYAARRAATRAMLCAWHKLDHTPCKEWLRLGREYLAAALRYLDRAEIH